MPHKADQQTPTSVARGDDLEAGAATTEITPRSSQFLYGYPHVQGTVPASTTLCSALPCTSRMAGRG